MEDFYETVHWRGSRGEEIFYEPPCLRLYKQESKPVRHEGGLEASEGENGKEILLPRSSKAEATVRQISKVIYFCL